jgi:predicted ATP-grasp superfamily ATP-dependent carboligase
MAAKMTLSNQGGSALRILLSEGSSTSAREAITALGLAGHQVEICDPDPFCLGRFSRFVTRFHRCPGISVDPAGYLRFLTGLLARRHFDVLIPIHEQGLLLAKVQEGLKRHVAIALPSFENYRRALSKAEFSRILSQLDLPQPETELLSSVRELRRFDRFPFILKTPIGTASRGIWVISDRADAERAIGEIEGKAFDQVLVQQLITGPLEHAQAVFCKGRLVGLHAYRQIVRGAGGGPAVKESVRRLVVRSHLKRIGAFLDWHGALSVDYILDEKDELPRYIDCNPRLVEPINALLSGLDLTDLLVRVSLGEEPPEAADDRENVHTHLSIQVLLGCAIRGGSRRDLLRESWKLVSHGGIYAGSCEELTPMRWDRPSAIPALVAALLLLANPKVAPMLPERRWGAHLLNSESIRIIEEEIMLPVATDPIAR